MASGQPNTRISKTPGTQKESAMTAALDPGRPFTGSERELLENTLELNRSELVRAVEHLSDTQARKRLVPR